jgi:hypothetical protein
MTRGTLAVIDVCFTVGAWTHATIYEHNYTANIMQQYISTTSLPTLLTVLRSMGTTSVV